MALERFFFSSDLIGPLCAPVVSVWPTLTREQQEAGAIVAVLVANGSPDSRDLMTLATMWRIPWARVREAYWEQTGEGKMSDG